MTAVALTTVVVGAAAASAALVPVVYRWAARRQIVDVPNARSSHVRATPLGGGLPIVACAIGGLLLLREVTGVRADGWWTSYLVGGLVIAAISWWDDMHGASTTARLVVHVAAAAIVLAAFADAPLPAGRVVGLAIGVVWIVGLVNAYNFMDGVDGIAGVQAAVAAAGWVWLGHRSGDPTLASAGALLGGASLGFLVHNWMPAKVFMGDVGAAFLGYSFAVFALAAGIQSIDRGVAGALFVWPFVFDTSFTLLRRLHRRENVLRAHRAHLYQRLVAAGWSHARVTTLYAALAAAGVGLAALWIDGGLLARTLSAAALVLLCAGLWGIARQAEQGRR